MKNTIFWSAIITVVLLSTGIVQIHAISNYDSGYDHGCSDSQLPPQDRYINEKGKGPSYHTSEFMDGYDNGFVDCKNNNQKYYEPQVNTAIDDSNFDDHSVSQPQNQEANTNQIGGCPKQIINGDCYLNQDQNVDNEFAQANRNN